MHFAAVLFDCDGVLVDSEPITISVLRDMLAEQGWNMTLQECMHQFVGKWLSDEAANIARHTGKPVTQAWLAEFRRQRDAALHLHLKPVAGITAGVAAGATVFAYAPQGVAHAQKAALLAAGAKALFTDMADCRNF